MTKAAALRVIVSLACIIVALLGVAWFVRRAGWVPAKSAHRIKVLSTQRLGTRFHITIIQVDTQQLVLGITPTQITLLHKIPQNGHALRDLDNDTEPLPAHDNHPDDTVQTPSRFRQIFTQKLLWLLVPLMFLFSLTPETVAAQTTLPAFTVGPQAADGSQTWSLSIQTLMLLTMMSFLPAILLTMTGFTRIIIVLGLLRNAMGTGASPPNSVLIGLALFLTFFTMSPVFDKVYSDAWQPLSQGNIEFIEALQRGAEPLREFMLHQTREADLSLFSNMANAPDFESPDQVPLRILLPAFVTSELKTAFQIGFTIFIPFLIIDLVIASILMSLGMMMVPPVTISLPFKLMLFVLADGWHLLLGSLARSFYQ